MRKVLPALLAISLVVGACGDDDSGGSTTTTTVPPTTTTPTTVTTTTTTTTMATTTTAAPRVFFLESPPGLFPPDPLGEEGAANGSGCLPEENGYLPDGVWFGHILSKDAIEVTFDLACFFFGDAAVAAAAEDGVTEVENNYYIRDISRMPYNPRYTADAAMWYLSTATGNFVPVEMAFADWPGPDEEWPCPGKQCGVWMYLNGGMITELYEQYVP